MMYYVDAVFVQRSSRALLDALQQLHQRGQISTTGAHTNAGD